MNKEQERAYFDHLKDMAEKGDAESQYALGLQCLYDVEKPANYKEAEKWFRMAAKQGHSEAQFSLGELYLFGGEGVKTDCKEAIFWLKQSAATAHPSHQFRLGYAYFCDGNYYEAEKWIRSAAEQGERYAQASMGALYLHGIGVIKDEEEAIKWFRRAAKQGNKNAQFEVRNYNRRKAGLPEETEGYENVTPSVFGAESEPISAKAIELQELFNENGIVINNE